ncbi:MAG: uroporphyrinogen decarboxylase [Salinirussus sp.]
MDSLLVRAARGEWTERPPVWLMRQAGRHLPEYRDLRAEYSFLEAISTPEIAAEITLLPREYYDPDGLVIFSDILTVLEPLGFSYHIEDGVGPVIENPIDGPADVDRTVGDVREELSYVGALLSDLDRRVDPETALIGFAGGPFTLASYAVAGGSTRSHLPLRRLLTEHPEAAQELLSLFASAVRESLEYQIESGADVVQLFDTYAGVLPPAVYRDVLLPLHREILEALDAPTIAFARNMGGRFDELVDSGADVIGLDWTVDIGAAREKLDEQPVQGNLDPAMLFAPPDEIERRTRDIIDAAGPHGHILNLGHGVHADTPVEGVRTFVETAKAIER